MRYDHVVFKYVMKLPPDSRPDKFPVYYTDSEIAAHFCIPSQTQAKGKIKNKTLTHQEARPSVHVAGSLHFTEHCPPAWVH